MNVYARWNKLYFPWVIDSSWTLISQCKDEDEAKSIITAHIINHGSSYTYKTEASKPVVKPAGKPNDPGKPNNPGKPNETSN